MQGRRFEPLDRLRNLPLQGADLSLETVDLVVVFDEDTPEDLLREIRPDVLVKGADYRIDEVVGADFVQSYGGEVLLADIVPGFSTTATIDRMNAS